MKLQEIGELNALVSNMSLDGLETSKCIETYKLLTCMKDLMKTFDEGRTAFFKELGATKTQEGGWDLLKLKKDNPENYTKLLERVEAENTEDLDASLIEDLTKRLNYISEKDFETITKSKVLKAVIRTEKGEESVDKDVVFNAGQKALLYTYLVKQ